MNEMHESKSRLQQFKEFFLEISLRQTFREIVRVKKKCGWMIFGNTDKKFVFFVV